MPLFNIDDKRIKRIIKSTVGATEGDFNGQKMMCGTTVNPVVVVNNLNVKFKLLTEADIANGQTVNLFEGLADVISLAIKQTNTETNQKNFTVFAENLDGETFSNQLGIADNSQQYVVIYMTDDGDFNITSDSLTNIGGSVSVPFRDLRIRQDSADGTAQSIKIACWYKV